MKNNSILENYNLIKNKETTYSQLTKEKIEKIDDAKWILKTMANRVKYQIPTISNSLESTHSLLSHQIPRINNFYVTFPDTQRIKIKIRKYRKLNSS